jgi:hypothetical protein
MVTSALLIVGQLATVCAAPLAVCIDREGHECVDFGAAACACHKAHEETCCHEHDSVPVESGVTNESGNQPCDCNHRPLTDDSTVARRMDWAAFGTPLAAGSSLAIESFTLGSPASCMHPSGASWHPPLLDLGTVCLRC